MRILALVTGPFYENQIHGGSYRILGEVLSALAHAGHKVTLLCGRGTENRPPYKKNDIIIKPILKLKRLFPNPWSVKLPDLLDTMAILRQYLFQVDVVYSHDSQFLWCLEALGATHSHRIVCSLRDFVYEDSLRGIFSMHLADCIIVNSRYAYDVLSYVDSIYHLGLDRTLVCIENGIDLDYWRSHGFSHLVDQSLQSLPKDGILLISPVRPEINKGLFESLQVLSRCVHSGLDTHLAICRYVDEGFPYMEAYNRQLTTWQKENPVVAKRLHVIPWLRSDDLRVLYQKATVTLCLGTFPEGFGSNVYVESVAAGIPCVSTIAGAMRTTFPEDITFLISPGSVEEAYQQIRLIIAMKADELTAWRTTTARYICDRYSIQRMRNCYVKAISGAGLNEYVEKNKSSGTTPPWQTVAPNQKKYDDFLESYI